MSDSEIIRLHAIVEGHVQGVSFRGFVFTLAEQIGLKGWVRNRWDGTVEVIAEGERNKLEKLLDNLYRGSPLSRVTGVAVEWQSATGEFDHFQIRASF